MKLFKPIYLALLIGIHLVSCTSSDTKKQSSEEEKYYVYNSIDDSLSGKNDMILFTIPSPLQVSTLMKIMDVDYNDNLLDLPNENAHHYSSHHSKAINLGMLCVDYGYTSINKRNQISLLYLGKIKKLMNDLNIENQNGQKAAELFISNMNNSDSIYSIMTDIQKDVQDFISKNQNNEECLLIVSGMYIESLYFASRLYDKQKVNIVMNQKNNTLMNYMIFQHKIFLDNIIEMHDKNNSIINKDLYSDLLLLRDEFTRINISYAYNEEAKKIVDVKFDKTKINTIRTLISEIRSSLQNG